MRPAWAISTTPGTLICDEDEIVEQSVVTGIAYAKDEAQILVVAWPTGRVSRPAFSGRWLKPASMST
jgi:aspartokinase